MFSLTSRLESSMRGWPHGLKRNFRAYLRDGNCRPGKRADHTGTLPYWLLFPDWLATAYDRRRPSHRNLARDTVNDILWGNYCIFLSVRIKDDLFDRQAADTALLFAADRFLVEGYDRLLCSVGHSDRFRDTCTGCIQRTLHAIVEVDALQRRTRASLKALENGHAEIASIFKIGSAAVCCIADRWQDYASVATACDELAIAGQILDDFQDMDEDLEDGRLNCAARFLLGTSRRIRPGEKKTIHRLAERLLYSDRADRLFAAVIAHVREAGEVLAPLGMKQTAGYIDKYVRSLERLTAAISRERLSRILNQ